MGTEDTNTETKIHRNREKDTKTKRQDTEVGRTDTKRDEAARQRHIRALEKPTSFAGHRFIIIYCILGMWGESCPGKISAAPSVAGERVFIEPPHRQLLSHINFQPT